MTTHDIEVIDPGLQATVQDAGRRSVGVYGVSPSGYADWFSARVANRLVGNAANAALLETTLNGMIFSAVRSMRIAVTGADTEVTVGERAVHSWQSIVVEAGDRIELAAARRGVRNYVAFEGGLNVSLVLGSASTDVTAGFGGQCGRSLRAGDRLRLHTLADDSRRHTLALRQLPPGDRPAWQQHTPLRVVAGPQFNDVADDNALLNTSFSVTSHCNRQGIRLRGIPVAAKNGWDVLSFGVCSGCVQVSNDGQPIILLCDHQTTGGYGVPLVVIAADLPHVAQLRPGDSVAFEAVNQATAAKANADRIHASAHVSDIEARP